MGICVLGDEDLGGFPSLIGDPVSPLSSWRIGGRNSVKLPAATQGADRAHPPGLDQDQRLKVGPAKPGPASRAVAQMPLLTG
ncbi:MAG TPA: hypothetical protein DCQ04_08580 [Actinobacteria bacterium]|nr:hypothetical protein [Actinomycetota bacterium]